MVGDNVDISHKAKQLSTTPKHPTKGANTTQDPILRRQTPSDVCHQKILNVRQLWWLQSRKLNQTEVQAGNATLSFSN